jgi:adenosylcobyric acid synthase
MKQAKAIQVCGTGSGVGKSVIVSGLCRIFLQDGYKVCPFKAQNMALNSFVTQEAGEIGRAQAAQAQACRIEPTVDMNPVLIKPVSDCGAQIIVLGKPAGNMNARTYVRYKEKLKDVVRKSYKRLAGEYELVVIEGAGSPAEINLKSHDIVNMQMAAYAGAPVILVGDIDKGGVFAWLVGTLALLSPQERKMVKGIIINKFRGDKSLLDPGIDFLERRTGIKVLGVLPYFRDIRIPEEDSVPLDAYTNDNVKRRNFIAVDVIYLPHISNFTDFDCLEKEQDVKLRYIKRPEDLNNPDVIIIPGTKNTISDLKYLKASGLADKILSAIRYPCLAGRQALSAMLVGICGGYQMLGMRIRDRHSLESNTREINGLGILPVNTDLEKEKTLTRVRARELASGMEISGYEIHHGNSRAMGGSASLTTSKHLPAFEIFERNGKRLKRFDGMTRPDGRVLGTYIHGLFDNDGFRRNWLNGIRQRKGWPALARNISFNPDKEFDKLAKLLRKNIDLKLLYRILNHEL